MSPGKQSRSLSRCLGERPYRVTRDSAVLTRYGSGAASGKPDSTLISCRWTNPGSPLTDRIDVEYSPVGTSVRPMVVLVTFGDVWAESCEIGQQLGCAVTSPAGGRCMRDEVSVRNEE